MLYRYVIIRGTHREVPRRIIVYVTRDEENGWMRVRVRVRERSCSYVGACLVIEAFARGSIGDSYRLRGSSVRIAGGGVCTQRERERESFERPCSRAAPESQRTSRESH